MILPYVSTENTSDLTRAEQCFLAFFLQVYTAVGIVFISGLPDCDRESSGANTGAGILLLER